MDRASRSARVRAFIVLAVLSAATALGAASPAAGEATWQPAFTIAPAESACAGDEFSMDLGGNPDGDAVAVWTAGVGSQIVVRAATHRPGMPAFGPVQTLTPPGNGTLNVNPAVVIDRSGNATAIWASWDNVAQTSRLQAAFQPAGGVFGAPREVFGGQTYFPMPADLGVDGQGNVTAVWMESNPTNTTVHPNPVQIRTATRPAQGEFGASSVLAGNGNAYDTNVGGAGRVSVGWPQIAVNDAGDALATWWFEDLDSGPPADYLRQVQASVRPRGGSFGAAAILDTMNGPVIVHPHAALDQQGNAFTTWFSPADGDPSDAPHYGLWVQVRPAAGPAGPPTRLAPWDEVSPGVEPAIAVDSTGAATVAWQGKDNSINASTREAGGSFGPKQTVSPPGPAGLPVIGADALGNTVLAWRTSSGPQVAIRPHGGTFGSPTTVTGAGLSNLAVFGAGGAVMVWDGPPSDGECQSIRGALLGPASQANAPSPTVVTPAPTPRPASRSLSVFKLKPSRGGVLALGLDLPSGTVEIRLTTSFHGRTITVARVRRRVSSGKTTIRMKPSRAAARLLKKKGRLSAKLRITFTPSAGATQIVRRVVQLRG